MYTAKELLNYKEQLEQEAISKTNKIYLNDSILHAMIVMKAIFMTLLKEDGGRLRMYCGKFSLFGDEIKDKIIEEKKVCYTEDLTEVELQNWNDLDFAGGLREKFIEFLKKKNVSFELIVQSNADYIKSLSIWDELDKDSLDKISVATINNEFELDHFVVADNVYRVENSDFNKTAVCCFNDKKTANVLQDCFNVLKTYAKQINIR